MDLRQVTDDALVFLAKALRVELTVEKHTRLMQAYLELRCWPDVQDALLSLKKAGIIRNSQLEFCLIVC